MKDEKAVMHDVIYMLRHHYGLWPDHCEDGHRQCKPGRPDIIVMNPTGSGYYIEVKDMPITETSFSFAEITDEQRKWLLAWEKARPGGSFLAIGITKTRKEMEAIYLIPWLKWLDVEDRLRPYQASLPLIVGAGMLKEVQSQHLDFSLVKDYACPRIKASRPDGGWRLPPSILL